MLVPKALQEGAQPHQAFRARPVEPAGAVAALAEEPGVLEDAEVLRGCRTAHPEMGGNFPGGQLLVANQAQDPLAARLGDGPQGGLHAPYFKPCLRKCQLTNRARH